MNINLVATQFDEIKASIIEKFKNDPKSPFKDYNFEGSALNYLIEILAYATFYNNFYGTVQVNELFLPYAQQSKNIKAIARSLGYIPRRSSGAIAYIRPSVDLNLYNEKTDNDIVIPIYTTLKSRKGLNYILMEEIRYRYNDSLNKWDLIKSNVFESDSSEPYYYRIKQGTFQSTRFFPTQMPLQRVTIPRTNIDADRDSIIVQDSVTFDYWRPFYDISSFDLDKESTELLNSTDTVSQLQNELVADSLWKKYILSMDKTKIFFVNETEDSTYIQFGDGQLGVIPENPMDVIFILTEGIAGNGDVEFTLQGSTSYVRNDGSEGTFLNRTLEVQIYPGTSSSGGAPPESSDFIKNFACSFFNTQNRAVIESDYEVFLTQQNAVRLNNIKCVGGEKLKPIIMGATGICANKYTPSNDIKQSLLNFSDKQLLKFILKNQNIVTINPVFINPEFVRINLDVDVFYNPLKYDDATIFSIVQATTVGYMMAIQGFNKYFKYSNLVKILDNLNEVDHNLMEVDFEYVKIFKKEELKHTTFINLSPNNPIKPNTIGKIQNKNYFLKVFNPSVVYDSSDPEIFVLPDTTINFIPGDYNNVPKIFLYELLEEEIKDGTSRLVLIEHMVSQFDVHRISGDDAPFYFKYKTIIPTGKKKILGEVRYGQGLIQLYLDDISFRFMDDNKKSRRLALETKYDHGLDRYIEIDAPVDAYTSYNDLFFYKYPFDPETNLPIPAEKEATDEYFFEMAFDTEKDTFQSEGNIIITNGALNIHRHPEVDKK